MATRYRLKRKTFGVIDAARDAIGGTVETAGDVVGSGLGKTAGALAGAAYAPTLFKGIGGALGGSGSVMGGISSGAGKALGTFAGATPLGWLGGAALGWGAAKLAGKLLKKTGQGISTQ